MIREPINSVLFLMTRVLRVNPVIPYYHIVDDNQVLHVKHLYSFRNVRQFRKDLDVFLKYYHPITLHDLMDSINGRRTLPRNSLHLTFDDGFRECHDCIAPILLEKGMPATFFITTGCVDNVDMMYQNKISLLLEHLELKKEKFHGVHEMIASDCPKLAGSDLKTTLQKVDYSQRQVVDKIAGFLDYDFKSYLAKAQPYLTSAQIRSLISNGFTIGAHSIDHPVFAELPLEEQLLQVRESVQFLKERFQLDYGGFAFPHHDAEVSNQFFWKAHEADVDVSFGTSGMVKEKFDWHFQRFPMEKTSVGAERIIAFNYARHLHRRMTGRLITART